jgi:hypothetical protein
MAATPAPAVRIHPRHTLANAIAVLIAVIIAMSPFRRTSVSLIAITTSSA